MIKVFLIIQFVLSFFYAVPQQSPIDSLKSRLELADEDTTKALLYSDLSLEHVFSKPDSGFYYASEGLRLSRKINFAHGIALTFFNLATYFRITGSSYQAMQYTTEALSIFKDINNAEGVILSTNMLAWLAKDQKDYRKAIDYAFDAMNLSQQHGNHSIVYAYSTIGECYDYLNQLDSALIYAEKAALVPQEYHWNLIILSRIHDHLNNYELSLQYYRQAVSRITISKDSSDAFIGMSRVFYKTGQTDSALHYATKALNIANEGNFLFEVQEASEILTKIYSSKRQNDSTLKYMQISIDAKDSLFSQDKVKQFQSLAFSEQLRQQEMASEKMQYRSRVRMNVLLIVVGFFLILAIILYRNNKRKQKVNLQLRQQKKEIQDSLTKLKETQNLLIQSEKMASLGELTAGIAHEIQNPLNFVNNFSDVNKELLTELKDEIKKGNIDEVNVIADDVISNEEKINHHGKRADAIVKGMLQHSRNSSGKKELTDINALCDEYLRLAYHGFRAKDKSFNAKYETHFDNGIDKINVVPQEMGRVILNLINNAFYAVSERKKLNQDGYETVVSVSTKKLEDKIEVRVKDNGTGIPQKVLDKIFQPFFTTKPTGQGTGLGLSLAYDIVKAHGGELKVETKEGDGSEFIIVFPV